MDFWKAYQTARASGDFGRQRLCLRSRDRVHASLSAVEPCGTRIEINRCIAAAYSEGARYMMAEDLTYDLLVSLYDVNSSSAVLLRASSPLDKKTLAGIGRRLGRMGKPNLEVRAVGLQSGDPAMLDSLGKIQGMAKCDLQEVDLFGTNARHVVFDLKVGMMLDLLPLNRLFRPDELVNGLGLDGFARLRSELQFV